MRKKSKVDILANTKILNDKTYQDFNKEEPDPKNPIQNNVIEIEQAPKIGKDGGDVHAEPQVGARDKNLLNETTLK